MQNRVKFQQSPLQEVGKESCLGDAFGSLAFLVPLSHLVVPTMFTMREKKNIAETCICRVPITNPLQSVVAPPKDNVTAVSGLAPISWHNHSHLIGGGKIVSTPILARIGTE